MSGTPVEAPELAALFPVAVQAVRLQDAGDPSRLLADERIGKERWAEKRLLEFAAGRQCARLALQRLGYPDAPLLSLPDRRPNWPAGITGSISHCAGMAGAVVAPASKVRSLGVDVEVIDAVDKHLWPRVLNASEHSWLQSLPAGERRIWATVIFSAKEAFYKCQYPIAAQWLEFEDVQVATQRPQEQFDCFPITVSSSTLALSGQGRLTAEHVWTGISWPCDVVPSGQSIQHGA